MQTKHTENNIKNFLLYKQEKEETKKGGQPKEPNLDKPCGNATWLEPPQAKEVPTGGGRPGKIFKELVGAQPQKGREENDRLGTGRQEG